MGTINKNGNISGLVGNLVFREWNGLLIVQSKPKGRKPAPGTIKAAKILGIKSKLSAIIRKRLISKQEFQDATCHRRLIKTLTRFSLSSDRSPIEISNFSNVDMSRLIGFPYNPSSHLEDNIGFKATINLNNDQQIEIQMPDNMAKEQIKTPRQCSFLQLLFHCLHISKGLKKNQSLGQFKVDINLSIPLSSQDIFNKHVINLPKDDEGMILLGLEALFFEEYGETKKLYNTKKFHPGGIIAGFIV